MLRIENYFEQLDFFDCYVGEPIVEQGTLSVSVRKLGIFPGHPLNLGDEIFILPLCRLIFNGVQKSERVIREYIGEPSQGKFKDAIRIVDGPFVMTVAKRTRIFALEGVLDDIPSWVDWEIEAESFVLETEPAIQMPSNYRFTHK